MCIYGTALNTRAHGPQMHMVVGAATVNGAGLLLLSGNFLAQFGPSPVQNRSEPHNRPSLPRKPHPINLSEITLTFVILSEVRHERSRRIYDVDVTANVSGISDLLNSSISFVPHFAQNDKELA